MLFRSGSSSSGNQLLTVYGTSSDYSKTYTYSICIEPDQPYYIYYYDSGSSSTSYGWTSGSYLQITYQNTTILRGTIPIGYSSSWSNVFMYHECQSNEIMATVTRRYGSSRADEEFFSLYQSSSNLRLLNAWGTSSDNSKTYTYSICLIPGQSYYIYYYDSSSSYYGWTSGSYLQITYQDNTIYRGTLASGSTSWTDYFTYPSCQSNEIMATVTRRYYYRAYEESFSIYRGTSTSGTLLLSKQGSSSD